jgi:PhnB protein
MERSDSFRCDGNYKEREMSEQSVATDTANVQPVPGDYGALTPYVIVRGVAPFIDFLTGAFGAVERFRVPNDDGTIGHAEVWLGNRVLMMFDGREEWPETPSFLTLYVDDCDAVYQRALRAGASEVTPLSTNAWGDRGSRIRDPFGNLWWIQTHVEDVSEEEMQRRMGEPTYLEEMEIAVETLDRELRRRSSGQPKHETSEDEAEWSSE